MPYKKISLLSFLVFFLALVNITFFSPDPKIPPPVDLNTPASQTEVLGAQTQAPVIYISNSREGFNLGGVFTQSSLDEPAINLETANETGTATIDVYQATTDNLLNFLIHNDKYEQTQKVDPSAFTKINTVSTQLTTGQNHIVLPTTGEGLWLLRIAFGTKESFVYLLRSEIAAVAKQAGNQIVVWTQNLATKRSVTSASLTTYSLNGAIKPSKNLNLGREGIISYIPSSDLADVGIVTSGTHLALVPMNLRYLNWGYQSTTFKIRSPASRYFIFTDRPLYRPGDTVYFKAIVREDDDARYKVAKGSVKVVAYKDWDTNSAFFEQTLPLSDHGSADGSFILPSALGTGNFRISVSTVPASDLSHDGETYDWDQNQAAFQVEHFRKPEYFLDISTDKRELVAKEDLKFTVTGNYFSGQPLSNQEVKYKVYTANFYEYDFLTDFSQNVDPQNYYYGHWGQKVVEEGQVVLDSIGNAEKIISTGTSANVSTKPQVFSVEVSFTDSSGNPVLARKNVLVYPAEFSIFRHSSFYTGQVNRTFNLPIIIKSRTTTRVKDIKISSSIVRQSWIEKPLEPGQKYPSYSYETETLSPVYATTDQLGKATLSFTPTKTGSYTFSVFAVDAKGNQVSKDFYTWVSEIDRPATVTQNYQMLKIESDKKEYLPGDTVNLKVWSDIPDSDILLSLERGRVDRFQVVKMSGKSQIVPVKLDVDHVPNIFAVISSFSDSAFHTNSVNLAVSAQEKRLQVKLAPSASRYGPGQTAVIDIQTLNSQGKPTPAEVSIWAVDKAIFELSTSNLPDIFNRYWTNRTNQTSTTNSLESIFVNTAEMGGCFPAGTKVAVSPNSTRPIETINPGDTVLTRVSPASSKQVSAVVKSVHKTRVDGYLVINTDLKITPNHILLVNGIWQTASVIQVGDYLTGISGQPIEVTSVEWLGLPTEVYNLEVADYHTFIASGYYVHNEKGAGDTRSVFKDTAYWNPTVRTDKDGQGRIAFKLPDNLTTWTVAAVAATPSTLVGQNTVEIVTSKEVITRLMLPNILRVGDNLYISSLTHNFTPSALTFQTRLEFDSGEIVSQPSLTHPPLSPNAILTSSWQIKPQKENPEAKITAESKSDTGKGDTIIATIPVLAFGFTDTTTHVGTDNQTYSFEIPPDTNLAKSQVTVSLSANLLGTLPSAMKYLIGYPYGCVEQTTSRLIPALIAKANLDLFYDAISQKDIANIIDTGIARLSALQTPSGGWGWWSEDTPSPYTTAYVLENLDAAKKDVVTVPDYLFNQAFEYFKNSTFTDNFSKVYQTYVLNLLGRSEKTQVTQFTDIGPTTLAYAVLANILAGNTNPDTNGYNKLIALSQTAGETVYWPTDTQIPYPSIETSTALAIRAIIAQNTNRDLAVKASRYFLVRRQGNYWANTHATAQLIKSIVALHKTGSESNPDFAYTVKIGDRTISLGRISSAVQTIKDVVIPQDLIKPGPLKIEVLKDGVGQLYSVAGLQAFRTDPGASAVTKTLTLTREYVNDKGAQFSLGVGDIVTVKLAVTGLPPDSKYLVVEDDLPSGMIPVNTRLKNESPEASSFWVNKEYTQNGVILSSSQPLANPVFTYKARVIAEGVFQVPPASAQLMYQPEVYARTGVSTLTTNRFSESPSVVQKVQEAVSKSPFLNPIFLLVVSLTALTLGTFFISRWKKLKSKPL